MLAAALELGVVDAGEERHARQWRGSLNAVEAGGGGGVRHGHAGGAGEDYKYRTINHIILEIMSKICKCLQIRIQVKRSCMHHLQVNNQ